MSPIEKVIINKNVNINPIWIMRQAGRYLPEFRKIREKNTDFIVINTPYSKIHFNNNELVYMKIRFKGNLTTNENFESTLGMNIAIFMYTLVDCNV